MQQRGAVPPRRQPLPPRALRAPRRRRAAHQVNISFLARIARARVRSVFFFSFGALIYLAGIVLSWTQFPWIRRVTGLRRRGGRGGSGGGKKRRGATRCTGC